MAKLFCSRGMGFIAAATLLLLAACTRDLPLTLRPGARVTVSVAGVTGISRTRILRPESEEYRKLVAWVARNRSGWSQYWATNPSRGVFVTAGDLHLQFTDSGVLVSTPSDGYYVKGVAPSDYAFLLP